MHFNLKSKGDSHARTVHAVRDTNTHYMTGRAYTRETGKRYTDPRGPKQKQVVSVRYVLAAEHRSYINGKTYSRKTDPLYGARECARRIANQARLAA